MVFLLELLLGLIEPILFVFGAIFTFIFGSVIYHKINSFLYSFTTPCLEMTTLLVALISPLAFFYGVHHKKFLTQRSNRHNLVIFVLSYVFGTIVTLLPIGYSSVFDSTQLACLPQTTLVGKIAQIVSTGLITSFLAYLNVDIGVLYANTVRAHLRKRKKRKKK